MKFILLSICLLHAFLFFGQDTISIEKLKETNGVFSIDGVPYNGLIKEGTDKGFRVGEMRNGRRYGIHKTYNTDGYCCQFMYLTSDTMVHYDEKTQELQDIVIYGDDKFALRTIHLENNKIKTVNWVEKAGKSRAVYNYSDTDYEKGVVPQVILEGGWRLWMDGTEHEISLTKGIVVKSELNCKDEECPYNINSYCYSKEDAVEDFEEGDGMMKIRYDQGWIVASADNMKKLNEVPLTWSINKVTCDLKFNLNGFIGESVNGEYNFPQLNELIELIRKKLSSEMEK